MISYLPEYGLTRADERLLRRHSRDIVERLATPIAVAELGSGSGKKDALDSGGSLSPAADLVLPHRNFAFGSGHVRA